MIGVVAAGLPTASTWDQSSPIGTWKSIREMGFSSHLCDIYGGFHLMIVVLMEDVRTSFRLKEMLWFIMSFYG